MRQDKLFSRILLIFSIANVAVPAPAVVRQRHLDLTKAASEKRSQGSGNGETGDLPFDSSSGIPPPNSPPGDWAWFHRLSSEPEVPESSSAASNRITTQAPGAMEISMSDSAHWGEHEPLLPHLDSPPDRFISDALASKILVSAAVISLTAGTAFAIHKSSLESSKHPYVSLLSPADI